MSVTKGAILVEKVGHLDKFEIIKYQIMNYRFFNKIVLNDTEENCLAYLGEVGKIRLTDFSKKASTKGILGSPAAVTNCVGKLTAMGLIVKEGVGKKIIYLNPKLEIQSEGNIVISLKLIKLEANKQPGVVQKNRRETQPA